MANEMIDEKAFRRVRDGRGWTDYGELRYRLVIEEYEEARASTKQQPRKMFLEGWVNVYSHGGCSIFRTRHEADNWKGMACDYYRVACINLDKHGITYEEGEGL